jgi:hypothetical protein
MDKRKKPATMTDEEWEDLDARALNTIRLCLVMMSCLTLLEKKQQQAYGAGWRAFI